LALLCLSDLSTSLYRSPSSAALKYQQIPGGAVPKSPLR
jgi:hypothetical protein